MNKACRCAIAIGYANGVEHVEFEWDPAKSERCLRERGFSFIDILPAFLDPVRHVEPDKRFDYGEDKVPARRRSERETVCHRLHVPRYGVPHHLRPQSERTGKARA